ncbi:hypothetical protein AB0D59_00355 [Streptomyces sp. NPDC048417]|uniref:hypothetical protein n=1 Tax=Streptomyces sp. NPDC048417 TaxID=3155387 RepID=UPI0034482FB3
MEKVVDACTVLKANLRAGNLGSPTSRRYREAVGAPVVFRPEAAQPFDDRCLSWQYDAHTVSIWTVDGRMKGIRFSRSPDQLKMLVAHRRGESDLVRRGGMWFLIATCELPDPQVYEPVDWIGVDRGVVNLATTSDGTNYQGRRLGRYRRWQTRGRAELQRKQTDRPPVASHAVRARRSGMPRARWPGRCRRRGQRARSRTLGVGVRHRTRTLPLMAAGGRVDATRDRPVVGAVGSATRCERPSAQARLFTAEKVTATFLISVTTEK